MIEIRNLSKRYGEVEALRDINLIVPDRAITAVVGASGAGKSTLAKIVSLLEKPSGGEILVNGVNLARLSGRELREARRAIGTIFQSSALLSRKTAAENIALPLEFLGVVQSDIDRRVKELLEAVGLSDYAKRYPAELSGGQRQRVGIARSLALRPKVLLSDEATSGLDPLVTQSILNLLKRLRDEYDLSIVMITHEMDAVRVAADYVAAIAGGSIVEQGSIGDLLADPTSPTGAQLAPLRAIDASLAITADITYGGGVPQDWLASLGEKIGARLYMLGANIEEVRGDLRGRARIGLEFSGESPDRERLNAAFRGFGLDAHFHNEKIAL
jgi:D-methionine transport system ATP-binding protein